MIDNRSRGGAVGGNCNLSRGGAWGRNFVRCKGRDGAGNLLIVTFPLKCVKSKNES